MYWYWVDKVRSNVVCLYWFSVLLWYSSLFQFVRFSIFSFFSFFTPGTRRHGIREYASKLYAFFPKSLLTVSETANLPSKIIICPSSVLTFFVNFSVSSFCYFFSSSRSSDIAGSVICRFLSLGTSCRCAVVWPVVFVGGVAVILDLLFFFPETMVFVVSELFPEKIASSFASCHATHPPSKRTRVQFVDSIMNSITRLKLNKLELRMN